MKEFILSEFVYKNKYILKTNVSVIPTEKVKEFIKRLKYDFKGTSYHDFMIFLDKLAGDKLK